ncbi:FAD binding domain-containing protein [Bradyrhizobium acaciae]|uniref:FAD binding domain-containing protein n=1 Tax=Bradyrhizobium acaciae TaxID=2683706 RepID=UPI001E4D51AF|nr:FAD binding domain-containing protein [Bradyrhizobium acaciae]MCC8977377.1 FAD binding domain-containing protein [Bradyrhizobium acaciae]
MKPAAFDYVRVRSVREAVDLLAAKDDAKILAGGQSLTPMLNLRLARSQLLIDIKRAEGLRSLAADDSVVAIGVGWTHAEIEDGVFEDPTRGLMRHVARGIAYRAVRNRGTIGGSLAHADPAADWVSTMAVLGATLVCEGAGGKRRHVAADSFLQGAFLTQLASDEVLVAVEVPRLSAQARWGYYKICRKAGEFAHALGAVIHDPARNICRIVVGATDGPPKLLPGTAAALAADPMSEALDGLDQEIIAALPEHEPAARRLHATAVRRAIAAMSTRMDH